MRSVRMAVAVILGLIVVATPDVGHAQEWSAEQQEVWGTVQGLWRVSSAGDLDSWFAMVSDDFRGWSNADPAPMDKETARRRAALRLWRRIFYNVHPLAIDIHGDVAIVFYSFVTESEYPDGSRVTATGRWTDIFRRHGESWLLIADSGGSS